MVHLVLARTVGLVSLVAFVAVLVDSRLRSAPWRRIGHLAELRIAESIACIVAVGVAPLPASTRRHRKIWLWSFASDGSATDAMSVALQVYSLSGRNKKTRRMCRWNARAFQWRLSRILVAAL